MITDTTDASATVDASNSVSNSGGDDDPSTTSPAYRRMEGKWRTCRAVLEGTDAIRAGGILFLPMLPGESDKFYEIRKGMSKLLNGFERTIRAAMGLVFQHDPVLGADVDPKLRADCENIDLEGNHIDVWAKDLFQDGETVGFGAVLAEYPRVTDPARLSAGEEADGGLRPYLLAIKAEDILYPQSTRINGRKVLTQITIREHTIVPVGRFGWRAATRYRVYFLDGSRVRYELWTVPEDGGAARIEDVARDTGVIENQTEIPISPLLLGTKLGPWERKPPAYDLAQLNLQHHRVSTGLYYLQELAFVPTPWRKNGPIIETLADGTPVYAPLILGVQGTIEIPTDGEVGYLSPDVSIAAPGAESITRIERQMDAAGLAFLATDTRAAQTAEGKRIDAAAQYGGLAADARALGDCLEQSLGFMANYRKLPFQRGGSLTINRDFEQRVIDAGLIAAYSNMESAGQLDLDTLWNIMEQGQALPAGFDREKMRRAILARGMDVIANPVASDPTLLAAAP
ncbi:MAG: DUF4055 domain-containing protein [Gemmatimonadaceae bacterium]